MPGPTIIKPDREQLRRVAELDSGLPSEVTDEMAIPTHTHWNPLIRWLFWRRYEEIARLAELDRGLAVLDFGCGIGVFLPTLCAAAGKVVAIDLFPQYARHFCRQQGLAVTFADGLDAVEDGSLDVIVAADVLEHIDDLEPLLATFRSKLTAGGRLLISGPTENLVYKLGRVLAGFGGKGDYHVTNVHVLERDIAQACFAPGRSSNLPFAIPPYLFRICEFTRTTG